MHQPAGGDTGRAWRFPVVLVAAGAVVGDVVAWYVEAGPVPWFLVLAGVFLLVRAGAPWMRCVGVALLAFGIAHGRADLAMRPHTSPTDVARLELPGTYEVRGIIARPPEERDGGVRLTVAVEHVRGRGWGGPAEGLVLLQIRHPRHDWVRGDEVRGWLRLRRPRNFGNPGEFDYERHLARRGVRVTSFLYRDDEIDRVAAPGVGLRTQWRSGVGQLFQEHAAGDSAAVLAALVLGSGGSLATELRERFARAGVSHLLAVSGLHVGFVAAVAYGSFRWLLARSERLLLWLVVPRVAAALTLIPVLLYAGIAGSNVATGRAVLMAGVVLGALLVERQRNVPVALALAALVVIATKPGVTAEVSFQLSFVAVAALLLAMDRLQRWWAVWEEEKLLRLRPRRAWFLRWLATYAVVSAAALLATTPLVALHFNRVSFIAPVANLVITPLIGSVVVPLGLAAALAYPLSETMAALLVHVAGPLVTVGLALVAFFADLPGASVRVATPAGWMLAALYVGGVLLLVGGRRARLGAMAIAVLGCTTHGVTRLHAWFPPEEVRVTFLSVGQGDCTIVEFPDGRVMVVDGGGLSSGSFDVGERIVASHLWRRGVTRVDILVATHPDFDHFGGLRFLAEAFGPTEVWVGDEGVEAPAWRRFAAAVERSGARWVHVRRGDERYFGAARVDVLWPPRDATDLRSNDRSVVLVVRYAGERLLLAGDIERRSEQSLVALDGDGLSSRILKSPHHGSATSSTPEFLDRVAPAAVVVSAGIYNRYGLPHRDVVRRYRARGAQILRTDLHGAVTATIQSDGRIRLDANALGELALPVDFQESPRMGN